MGVLRGRALFWGCVTLKLADGEVGPWCHGAKGGGKGRASRRFLLSSFAWRTGVSALLIFAAGLDFRRDWVCYFSWSLREHGDSEIATPWGEVACPII